jgi:hypothetical protein
LGNNLSAVPDAARQEGMDFQTKMSELTRGLGLGTLEPVVGTRQVTGTGAFSGEAELLEIINATPTDFMDSAFKKMRQQVKDYYPSKLEEFDKMQKEVEQAASGSPEQQQLAARKIYETMATSRGPVTGTVRDVKSRREAIFQGLNAKALSELGMSKEQMYNTVGAIRQDVGGEFADPETTREDMIRALTPAVRARDRAILTSAEEYIGIRGRLSDVGAGSEKQTLDVLTKAVAGGMDTSKTIQQMVNATTQMSQSTVGTGVSAAPGIISGLTGAFDALRRTDIPKNIRNAMGITAMQGIESATSNMDVDLYNLSQISRIQDFASGADMMDTEMAMQMTLGQTRSLQKGLQSQDPKERNRAIQRIKERFSGKAIDSAGGEQAFIDQLARSKQTQAFDQTVQTGMFKVSGEDRQAYFDANFDLSELPEEQRRRLSQAIAKEGYDPTAFGGGLRGDVGLDQTRIDKARKLLTDRKTGAQGDAEFSNLRDQAQGTRDSKVIGAGIQDITQSFGSLNTMMEKLNGELDRFSVSDLTEKIQEATSNMEFPELNTAASDLSTAAAELLKAIRKMNGEDNATSNGTESLQQKRVREMREKLRKFGGVVGGNMF